MPTTNTAESNEYAKQMMLSDQNQSYYERESKNMANEIQRTQRMAPSDAMATIQGTQQRSTRIR